DGRLRIGGRLHHLLRNEFAVDVRQGNGDLCRAEIHAYDDSLIVQAKKGGAASARQAPGGTFKNPILVDELLNNQGNGRALEPGDPRQIGTRNRLARPDQVQDDPPVDVANHFTRGGLHGASPQESASSFAKVSHDYIVWTCAVDS